MIRSLSGRSLILCWQTWQNEHFGVNDLARESVLRACTLLTANFLALRKIRVSQFIREVPLKKAMDLLRDGTFTASGGFFKVGFGSPRIFNKCFREFFGCTPGDKKIGLKIGKEPRIYFQDGNR